MTNPCIARFAKLRRASVLMGAAALAVTAAALAGPAQAQGEWPGIPPELGPRPPIDHARVPYRCSDGPVYNFYYGAWYGGEPPGIYLGYAYRPYYRYTAYRVIPRTYFCDAW